MSRPEHDDVLELRVRLQAYEDAVAAGELVLSPRHRSSDISPAVAGSQRSGDAGGDADG